MNLAGLLTYGIKSPDPPVIARNPVNRPAGLSRLGTCLGRYLFMGSLPGAGQGKECPDPTRGARPELVEMHRNLLICHPRVCLPASSQASSSAATPPVLSLGGRPCPPPHRLLPAPPSLVSAGAGSSSHMGAGASIHEEDAAAGAAPIGATPSPFSSSSGYVSPRSRAAADENDAGSSSSSFTSSSSAAKGKYGVPHSVLTVGRSRVGHARAK